MKAKYSVLRVVSPSQLGERKNQDRAVFCRPSSDFAVCDGVSSSPYSAKAATLLTLNAQLLLKKPKKYLPKMVDKLQFYRQRAVEAGIKVSPSYPEAMQEILLEAGKTKLQKSFQSTMIAAKLSACDDGIRATIICFGDSGFFAVNRQGELLWNNLGLDDSGSFNGLGNTTAVLPDHFGSDKGIIIEKQFNSDTEFILCSDGFYQSFEDFSGMHFWLKDNKDRLSEPAARLILFRELHRKLADKCGDDDMSLIWIYRKDT